MTTTINEHVVNCAQAAAASLGSDIAAASCVAVVFACIAVCVCFAIRKMSE